jgi:hypothetical protein
MRHGRLLVVVASAALALLVAGPLAAGQGPVWSVGGVDPSKLPMTFGISVDVYGQTQDYDLDRLSFSLPGLAVDPSQISIDNSIGEANVKFDAWLLPFLNLFGIVGSVQGKTDVDFSHLQLPVPVGRLRINYDGAVYGVGVTLAGGGERWFASLTGLQTESNLSGDFDSDVSTLVVMPRVGLHDERGSFWIGAMYQKNEEKHKGTINIAPFGRVGFDVTLADKTAVNFLIGAEAALTEHWRLEVEGGISGRRSAEVGLSYRF